MKGTLISAAIFIRWGFGYLFLLDFLGSILKHSYIAGLLFFLAAIVSFPLTATMLEYKLNFQMSGPVRFLVVFVLIIVASFALPPRTHTAINSTDAATEIDISKDPTAEMNISKTPDETPLMEYHVSVPYSSDMDSWMTVYAQKHRTNNKKELHLFTFSDGKQFEYYMAATGTRDEDSLFPASWTEEPNESLKPTKISEQQFQQNMQSILSDWGGSHYELKPDNMSGEILYVYLGEMFTPLVQGVEASILKNYIDLKPDRTEYTIAILTPSAVEGVNISHTLKFTPQNHTLIEEKSLLPDDGKKSRTVWYDATYTSIVNAIETTDFTNNPGKVGSFGSQKGSFRDGIKI